MLIAQYFALINLNLKHQVCATASFPLLLFLLATYMYTHSLTFQYACVTLCRGRPEAEGICQVAVKQTGGPEIIIQR